MRNTRLMAAMNYCTARQRQLNGLEAKSRPVVYVLECEGFYKIGQGDVRGRMNGLQTGNPFKINLIGVIKCEDPVALESELHAKFKAYRVRGEWFKLGNIELSELITKLFNLKLPAIKP